MVEKECSSTQAVKCTSRPRQSPADKIHKLGVSTAPGAAGKRPWRRSQLAPGLQFAAVRDYDRDASGQDASELCGNTILVCRWKRGDEARGKGTFDHTFDACALGVVDPPVVHQGEPDVALNGCSPFQRTVSRGSFAVGRDDPLVLSHPFDFTDFLPWEPFSSDNSKTWETTTGRS